MVFSYMTLTLTFDHVITFFFNAYKCEFLASLNLGHNTTFTEFTDVNNTKCTEGKHIIKRASFLFARELYQL